MPHQQTLPTHNLQALRAMRWLLDRIHAGESIKDLDHMVDLQLRKHKNGPVDLRQTQFGHRPLIMSGFRVPIGKL